MPRPSARFMPRSITASTSSIRRRSTGSATLKKLLARPSRVSGETARSSPPRSGSTGAAAKSCAIPPRQKLKKELENSLRRLQTDVIDIYQVHWPDESVPRGNGADTRSVSQRRKNQGNRGQQFQSGADGPIPQGRAPGDDAAPLQSLRTRNRAGRAALCPAARSDRTRLWCSLPRALVREDPRQHGIQRRRSAQDRPEIQAAAALRISRGGEAARYAGAGTIRQIGAGARGALDPGSRQHHRAVGCAPSRAARARRRNDGLEDRARHHAGNRHDPGDDHQAPGRPRVHGATPSRSNAEGSVRKAG